MFVLPGLRNVLSAAVERSLFLSPSLRVNSPACADSNLLQCRPASARGFLFYNLALTLFGARRGYKHICAVPAVTHKESCVKKCNYTIYNIAATFNNPLRQSEFFIKTHKLPPLYFVYFYGVETVLPWLKKYRKCRKIMLFCEPFRQLYAPTPERLFPQN